jgi:hypothetical protein
MLIAIPIFTFLRVQSVNAFAVRQVLPLHNAPPSRVPIAFSATRTRMERVQRYDENEYEYEFDARIDWVSVLCDISKNLKHHRLHHFCR